MAKKLVFVLALALSNFCLGDTTQNLNLSKIVKFQNRYRDSINIKISKQNLPLKIESTKMTESTKSGFDCIEIFQDVLSNVIGGVIFAILLFIVKEYLFKTEILNGEWTSKITTTQTSHEPYMNLSIEYRIHLLQMGNQISGRGEKIRDINPDGSDHHVYPTAMRTEIEITGYYERYYLKPSKLFLLIKEHGRIRVTSSSHDLSIPFFNKKNLVGKFVSTAANSRGDSTWNKLS